MINEALLPDDVQSYIRTHGMQTELPRILNGVLKEMPEDPLDHVVWETARLTPSLPIWSELQPEPGSEPLALRFQLAVSCRGQRVIMGSLGLGDFLKSNEVVDAPQAIQEKAARGGGGSKGKPAAADSKRPSAEVEAPKTPLELATESLALVRAIQKLRDYFQDLFEKAFKSKPVTDFLDGASAAEALFLQAAPIEPPANFTWEASAAFGHFIDQLLSAAARAVDCNRLEFLREQLEGKGFHAAAPPLRSLEELGVWEERWPHVGLPLFHGGSPGVLKAQSLRIAASVSAFVGQPSQGSKAPADSQSARCPSVGWLASAADLLTHAEAEVIKVLQSDKASAAMVVDGVAYGHATGLLKSFEIAQDVLKKALGDAMSKECSGVFLAAADEAFLEAEGLYELEAGKKLTMEQLVDLYAQLSENGWLKTIIRPFRDEDMVAGCRLLLAKRPALCLLARSDLPEPPAIEAPEQEEAGDAAQDDPSASGVPFGRLSQLPASIPKAFDGLLEASRTWSEAGPGFVSCITFDSVATASSLPSAVEILLAVGGKALLLPGKLTGNSLQLMSEQADQALLHLFAA